MHEEISLLEGYTGLHWPDENVMFDAVLSPQAEERQDGDDDHDQSDQIDDVVHGEVLSFSGTVKRCICGFL
ncbi:MULTISPECIES: hypothetical protein [unclassified Pannonibacter]|uniref:hypothetical protein n=1 Tax=unclassified Pannonibacter TaxID=2627228 RepID=UPI001645C081|nr:MULTISPECIES: hypothetical protein [unclassified Pannonibacter]